VPEVSALRNPFEVLGLNAGADADDVRNAYRRLVKTCHPDKFLDADERKAAQEKMIALNLAYEEALKLTASRRSAATDYNRELSVEEAIALADKMLRRDSPASALRQLMRTKARTAAWFAMQGNVLMALELYENAHQSYREAVRREPNNNVFRQGALDAAVALKKSRTPIGRIKKLVKQLKRK
jgi:tetratricopeptide (TPR) repeat protein